jgi:hypothetical protein
MSKLAQELIDETVHAPGTVTQGAKAVESSRGPG